MPFADSGAECLIQLFGRYAKQCGCVFLVREIGVPLSPTFDAQAGKHPFGLFLGESSLDIPQHMLEIRLIDCDFNPVPASDDVSRVVLQDFLAAIRCNSRQAHKCGDVC